MKEYKQELIQFHSDLVGNGQVFLYTNDEQYTLSDDSIECRLSFVANGEEWACNGSWNKKKLTLNMLDDEDYDIVEWVTDGLRYADCLTHPNRKLPPYEKQHKVIDEISNRLNLFDDVVGNIWTFWDAAQTYVRGTENDQRIENLEKQLAEAKAKAESTSIESLIMRNVVDALTPSICEKIQERVGALAGAVPTSLEIKIGDVIRKLPEDIRHAQFEKILAGTIAGMDFWLVGDAGTGKSYLCGQIAQAMGAKYFCTGAIMDEFSGLKGFIDANGVKHGTEFTKALDAMEAGEEVVICFDEADGSIPEVMIALNNFLAGGVIECMGKAYTKKDNLHIMACGNTNGRGGSTMYTRQIIDEATLDRFTFMKVDYDPSIELNAANGDQELATFCRELRKSASNCGIQMLVTYRAIKRIAVLSQVWSSMTEALQASVIRGLDKSDIETILKDMDSRGYQSMWKTALTTVKEMVA